MEKYVPFMAVIFDSLIGDPRSKLHPVVLIGNLIAALERRLLKPGHSALRKRFRGGLLVLVVLAVVYGAVYALTHLLFKLNSLLAYAGEALILSFAIAPRSLAEAGREISNYLMEGKLEQARNKVGWIVGRDTYNLSVPEITRATVETVAENIVDGVISPLFYFAVGGAPLAFVYRAVNTLDSMVGYRNEKYIDFGKAAARVDDAFNFIPARLTGILLILAALLLGYDARNAAKMILRDAQKHPSPNSGIAEAGVAGALGVRLGGLNYYGGVPSFRAHMGEAQAELAPVHIKQTIKIMYTVTVLFVGMLLIMAYFAGGSYFWR